MITVYRLNGEEFLINPHLIEVIEAAPDTTITLTTGRKFIVKTPVPEIVDQIIKYRRMIGNQIFTEDDGVTRKNT
jgi:flagellar protein FlbD